MPIRNGARTNARVSIWFRRRRLFVALALPCAANGSDAAGPARAAGCGAAAANYIAASINFPSGTVGGVGCASLSSCIADTRSTPRPTSRRLAALSTAAVNTPRIDCSNATCGLLNEGASTNLASLFQQHRRDWVRSWAARRLRPQPSPRITRPRPMEQPPRQKWRFRVKSVGISNSSDYTVVLAPQYPCQHRRNYRFRPS